MSFFRPVEPIGFVSESVAQCRLYREKRPDDGDGAELVDEVRVDEDRAAGLEHVRYLRPDAVTRFPSSSDVGETVSVADRPVPALVGVG
jgi:hypothetical protein